MPSLTAFPLEIGSFFQVRGPQHRLTLLAIRLNSLGYTGINDSDFDRDTALAETPMSLENWKTQVRKGLLDLCVLNLLRGRDYYGYELVQNLKSIDGLRMREGNVYPILARLEEEQLVTSNVRTSTNGPPRKYFRITAAGVKAIKDMNGHWNRMEKAVKAARNSCNGGA